MRGRGGSAPPNSPPGWLRNQRVNSIIIIIPHHSHYSEKSRQAAKTATKHEQPEEMGTYGD